MARNGPEFEKMTMEKQKDNPKFSFLFGGEFYSYYKCKLALEQQQRESPRPAAAASFGVACRVLCEAGRWCFRCCFCHSRGPATEIESVCHKGVIEGS